MMEGKDQASFQVRPAPLFHIFSSLIPSPVVGSNPALVFSAYRAEPRPHNPPPQPPPQIETSAQRFAADQNLPTSRNRAWKMAGGKQINSGECFPGKQTKALK